MAFWCRPILAGHKFPVQSEKDSPLGVSSKMLVSQQPLAHIGAMCESPLCVIHIQNTCYIFGVWIFGGLTSYSDT